MTRVFLSHSSKDKEFARMLHASFVGANIESFLDEENIKIGDSIPDKVYEGIDSSTCLIYIISQTSLNSSWVKEELNIAKMREKTDKGFKVLPILIETIELPSSISYVKYGDFREWRNPDSFRKNFLNVLKALDIMPKLVKENELRWFAKYSSKLRECIHWLTINTYEMRGGLSNANQDKEAHYMAAKKSIIYQQLTKDIEVIIAILPDSLDENSKLLPISKLSNAILSYVKTELSNRREYRDRDKINTLVNGLVVLLDVLENLRGEFETILLAGMDISE